MSFMKILMTLNIGAILLFSFFHSSNMFGRSSSAAQDIYSRSGNALVSGNKTVAYNYGNWHVSDNESDIAFQPALFDDILSQLEIPTEIKVLIVDKDDIEVSWDGVEKQIVVECGDDMLGRTQIAVFDVGGMGYGSMTVGESPARYSIVHYPAGTYVITVSVDDNIVGSFKSILK